MLHEISVELIFENFWLVREGLVPMLVLEWIVVCIWTRQLALSRLGAKNSLDSLHE